MVMQTLHKYRGNKGIKGLYQFIINRIPECETFIEAFAGSGAITKKLLHGSSTDKDGFSILNSGTMVHTIVNDCNRSVCDLLKIHLPAPTVVINFTAAQLFNELSRSGKDIFVYADPPYEFSTRSSNRRIYKYEMTVDDHQQFLLLAAKATFNCMISHYECQLYDEALPGWNKETFKVSYHGTVKQECIYYNYPKPSRLLTYMYVGSDCWDRQRVTRKINRLSKKLLQLPAIERNAVLNRVNNSITI